MAASRKIELLYEPVPSPGNIKIGAAIRATVHLALSLWLYSVMQASDMMLWLVAGALSMQDSGYATFTRVVLMMAGAFTAAYVVALLDSATNGRDGDAPHPLNAPFGI